MGGVSRSACGPAIARRLGTAALVLSLLVAASRCAAAEPPGASTSDETRAEARRAIPMAKIDPAFQQRVGEVAARFGGTVPRPPHWGGNRLWVERIELWTEGANRVHDRAVWTRPLQPAGEHAFTGGPWRSTRLNP